MSEPVRVTDEGAINDGEALVVLAGRTGTGAPIAVFFEGGDYFALDDTCTHEDASLADGWIEDGQVECPLHSAKFCLRTGRALCLPATADARTHRVEVRDGGVFLHVGVPAATS